MASVRRALWVAAFVVGGFAVLHLTVSAVEPFRTSVSNRLCWVSGVLAVVLLGCLAVAARRLEEELRRRGAELEAIVAARTAELQDANVRLQEEIGERRQAEERLRQLSGAVEQSPVATVITDRDGTIQYVNPAFCHLTGYSSDEAVGRNPKILKSGVTADSVYRELWSTISAGRTWEGELTNRRKNGDLYQERSIIAPVLDPDGSITHYLALKEDVTERRKTEEELAVASNAIRSSINGIAFADLDGRLRFVNAAFLAMWGYGRDSDVLGRPVTECWESAEQARGVTEALQTQGSWTGEMTAKKRDGSHFDALVSAHLVRRNDGQPLCMMASFLDISVRKRTEHTLRQASLVVEDSDVVIFRWRPTEGWPVELVSQNVSQFGYTPEELLSGTVPYTAMVHPEDLDRVAREVQEHTARGTDRFRQEYRLVTKDGTVRWVDDRTAVERDSDGRVVAHEGVVIDITERKRSSDELQRLNRELQEVVGRLQRRDREATLVSRLNDLLQSCQTVREAHRVVELSLAELFPDRAGWLAILAPKRQVFEVVGAWGEPNHDEAVFASDQCWALRRGQPHMVEDPASALLCWHLEQPVVSGYLCLPLVVQGEAMGVLHLKATSTADAGAGEVPHLAVTVGEAVKLGLSSLRLREVLREQAIRDQLTGLYNRRFLDEVLPRELRRCLRKEVPLTLAMADLDHFKRFNDIHGHQAGDQLLRKLGALLKRTLRAVDVICRFGGDEFVLVLPEASVAAVLPRLEDLKDRARELWVEVGGKSVEGVSVSIGVAQAPDHGVSEDNLLRAADHALYTAKENGRDGVVVFGSR